MTEIEIFWLVFWIGGGAFTGGGVMALFSPPYWPEGGMAGGLLGAGLMFATVHFTRILKLPPRTPVSVRRKRVSQWSSQLFAGSKASRIPNDG
jgi:hypothetical protein